MRHNFKLLAVILFCSVGLAIACAYLKMTLDRSYRAIQLRTVLLAVSMYESNHGVRPDDVVEGTSVMSSWRYRLTPYVTSTTRYGVRLDKRWDDPENSDWRQRNLDAYCWDGNTNTSVFRIIGSDTAYDPDVPTLLEKLPNHLIVLVGTSSNTHWMKPGDISPFSLFKDDRTTSQLFVAFAGGDVCLLQRGTSRVVVENCMLKRTASEKNRLALLRYAIWQR